MGEQVAARSFGGIAQLGEHLPCKQGVKGSNPFISTKAMKRAHAAVPAACRKRNACIPKAACSRDCEGIRRMPVTKQTLSASPREAAVKHSRFITSIVP